MARSSPQAERYSLSSLSISEPTEAGGFPPATSASIFRQISDTPVAPTFALLYFRVWAARRSDSMSPASAEARTRSMCARESDR